MSQWAREHPELCEEGVTAYDYYAERADLLRKEQKESPRPLCPTCEQPMSLPYCQNSHCERRGQR